MRQSLVSDSIIASKDIKRKSKLEIALDQLEYHPKEISLLWLLPLFLVTTCTYALFWLQSLELYRASAFSNPGLTALGALLMVVAFSAQYAWKRSTLGLVLCGYAICYEVYFVVAGTLADESYQIEHTLEDDAEINLAQDRVKSTEMTFNKAMAEFENPSSKVYQNSWFKKTSIDPAFSAREEAVSALVELRTAKAGGHWQAHVVYLKVLYRLGLVLLCMVLVHASVVRLREVKAVL